MEIKRILPVLTIVLTILVFAAVSMAAGPGSIEVARANPCGGANPCGMKNPCAAKKKPRLRKKRFKNTMQAARLGKRLWADPKLGRSGMSCKTCHAGGKLLNLEKVGAFPHYVKMPNDVVTLDQMINFCMVVPMKARPLRWNSPRLTALAAYYRVIVKRHKKNPCGASNPCGMKNPCGGR